MFLNRTSGKIRITSDSAGTCATVIQKTTYEHSWEKDYCIFFSKRWASLVDLMNMTIILVIDNTKYHPNFGFSHKERFLFASKHH